MATGETRRRAGLDRHHGSHSHRFGRLGTRRQALDLAADLAETYQGELLLVHVLSSAPLSDAEREMAAAEYADELAEWTTRHVKPATGGIEGLLMGSVSHRVSHLAECSCITVR